jgi:putative FmdB family regulatory protein
MPVYTYRREDGSTFDYRQKFMDDPLTVDPETGQRVVRVVQAAGVIFKGSGFYVNDSKNASKSSANGTSKNIVENSEKASTKTETSKDSSKVTSSVESPKDTSTVVAAAD